MKKSNMEVSLLEIRQQYTVELQNYVGPLDLLYELIVKNKLSVNEIALAKVAFGFLSVLEKEQGKIKSEQISFFIETASSLVLIKTITLLPVMADKITTKEKVNMELLKQKLRVYVFLKPYFKYIEALFQTTSYLQPLNDKINKSAVFKKTKIVKEEIEKTMDEFMEKWQKIKTLKRRAISVKITVQEVKAELRRKISQYKHFLFDLVIENKSKKEKVIIFLAMLELLRDSLVKVKQEQFLGAIYLKNNR